VPRMLPWRIYRCYRNRCGAGWLGPYTRFPFPEGERIPARVKIMMLLISVCRTFASIGIIEEAADCVNTPEKIRPREHERERSRLFSRKRAFCESIGIIALLNQASDFCWIERGSVARKELRARCVATRKILRASSIQPLFPKRRA